ncbi:armadillo-type protein [Zychaea mexicana]|uniref:armadillo-type protein n=1 Tax=Zychaea mexicana TaxID=64656 RepID=UPI0022FEF5A2|nr:armadillo-type protein [Zychaea mexicana]KAI9490173.1 armadillo-type protein [Zychaea mexicana]
MNSDLDRAQSMLRAIPLMSKEIDDTICEKVLSFLDSVIARGYTEQFDSWQILDILNQACEKAGQDYRVNTLCYRLLGSLISHGKQQGDRMFAKTLDQYPQLLKRLCADVRSNEPAVRCASLEAFRKFLKSPCGAQWILNNDEAKLGISRGFMDDSAYVSSESCKIFEQLVSLGEDNQKLRTLCQILNPAQQVRLVLQNQDELSTVVPALDFCWYMANARTSATYAYMLNERLLLPLLHVVNVGNRMARTRAIEIMSVIFTWTPNPLALLVDGAQGSDDKSHNIKLAYDYIVAEASKMISNPSKSDQILAAISLLESSVILLQRFATSDNPEIDALQADLLTILNVCVNHGTELGRKLRVLAGSEYRLSHLIKSMAQAVLRAMDSLFIALPACNMDASLEKLFKVLSKQDLSSEPLVLKATLKVILTMLHSFANKAETDVIQATMKLSARKMLDILDSSSSMDGRSVSLILETFEELLSHEKLSIVIVGKDIAEPLISMLNLKLLETEWDIRDAVIGFIGSLFKQPTSDVKVSFALDHGLPLLVFDMITDREPYVRATALDALQNLMQSKDGWMFIQRNQHTRRIASELPGMLYDTEAFVRRAALDAILCLVANRSCEGMVIESMASSDRKSLNPVVVAARMDDSDSSVTIRMCRLFYGLWLLHLHESEQHKRTRLDRHKPESSEAEYQSIFYMLQGDYWIIEATTSTARRVRAEAYDIIRRILDENQSAYAPIQRNDKKRTIQEDADKDTLFLEKLSNIDLEKLKITSNPEHLYQEALDINAEMMMHSLEPNHPDDDRNILDCYN